MADVAEPKKRLRPKTYSVAVYVVGIFVLVEVVALGAIFLFRQYVTEVEKKEEQPEQVVSAETPDAPRVAPTAPTLPTPKMGARLALPDKPKEDPLKEMLDRSRDLRDQRKFSEAESLVEQVLAKRPKDTVALSNLAMIREERDNPKGALEAWKQVTSLSDDKVTKRMAQERISFIEQEFRRKEDLLAAERRKQEEAKLAAEREKIFSARKNQPKIFIEKVTTNTQPSTVENDFVLVVPEGARFDARKLKVQVYVYDRLPSSQAQAAKIQARFLNSPPNWKKRGHEILRTKYVPTANGREYYGYVIRLFYEGKLQDEKAMPGDLLSRVKKTS